LWLKKCPKWTIAHLGKKSSNLVTLPAILRLPKYYIAWKLTCKQTSEASVHSKSEHWKRLIFVNNDALHSSRETTFWQETFPWRDFYLLCTLAKLSVFDATLFSRNSLHLSLKINQINNAENWSQSYDFDLQCQRCKKLQRN
jgi:hypothetical protein